MNIRRFAKGAVLAAGVAGAALGVSYAGIQTKGPDPTNFVTDATAADARPKPKPRPVAPGVHEPVHVVDAGCDASVIDTTTADARWCQRRVLAPFRVYLHYDEA